METISGVIQFNPTYMQVSITEPNGIISTLASDVDNDGTFDLRGLAGAYSLLSSMGVESGANVALQGYRGSWGNTRIFLFERMA